MDITIGIVRYTLSEEDAKQINRRRTNGSSIAIRMKAEPAEWSAGAQAHIGNDVESGQAYPALAMRVRSAGCANLQVLLDGNNTYWATSRNEGTLAGTWSWPPRV